ncbi:RDD family protein [Acidihalobacter prosperus]|uniref:RDD family protein n=1 Tax=Acidihalobacter prosperus TaxID=160660 RepID=UPI00056F3610|nr:RDD family protein [Acidihalobacter prosperus]
MTDSKTQTEEMALKQDHSMDIRVGLPRRLLSIVYDSLLMFALLIVANALLIPFQHGKPIAPGNHLYQLYLLYVIYLFFAWFWIHGGQTLGMKAWGIRLVSTDGKPIGWKRATVRFAAASFSWILLGSGFLWSLFDPDKRALHDILSHTRLVRVRFASAKTSERKQTDEKEKPERQHGA